MQMETCDTSLDNDYLVTDLVQELSSGFEIPFLFDDSLPVKNENPNFREAAVNEYNWGDEDVYITTIENDSDIIRQDIDDDFQNQLGKNDIVNLRSDSSGHGSGSESSLPEIWTVKSELDTPPVTPPEERTSPDNVFVFSSNNLKVIPVQQKSVANGSVKLFKQSCSNTSKRVRIQPKPHPATLGIIDAQNCQDSTIVCNVFKEVLQNNNSCLEESQDFLNLLQGDVRKSVLTRNELEALQAKRKQERMIRNRESAYLSRKRKKEHVANLEKQVEELTKKNDQLRLENYSLRKRLSKYEEISDNNINGKTRSIFADSPKKTTALLALMLTVCLNIGSFSTLINEREASRQDNSFVKEAIVPFRTPEMRHSRSLLWTEPELDMKSSLSNLTKTSCPVYINQTESIRLESELRRWIRGDDDFSRPSKRNISKINQYFYAGEKSPKHRKRKNRQRARRPHPSLNDANLEVFQMKPQLFNFDTFFEAIHRRDDTFYLVSFSGDHLLLPALAHNKTSRPKMSLMLPAFLSNSTSGFSSDQVEMMQIDCEVTNTQLLSVNENDIPSHMRPYSNATTRRKNNVTDSPEFERFFVNDDELLPLKHFKEKNASEENNFTNGSTNLNDLKSTSITPRYLYDNKFTNNWISSRSLNRTYNGTKDNLFIDNNGKKILKNLMASHNGTDTKAVDYGSKRPFEKFLKSSAKYLLP